MNLAALVRSLRRDLDDTVEPYLWATQDLKDYINEAISEAASRALLIYDETSPVTQIDSEPLTAVYALDNAVIDVDRVLYDGRLLVRTTKPKLDNGECQPLYGDYGSPFDNDASNGGSLSGQSWEFRRGRPYAFVEEVNSIRLYPMPTQAGSITMSLWRTPIDPLDGDEDEPEIQDSYQVRMLDWAKHRAYDKRDTDAEDVRRAALYEARFTASFGERRDANVQRKQKIKRSTVCKPRW